MNPAIHPAIAKQLESLARLEIDMNGYFGFEKNIYLIEGIAR